MALAEAFDSGHLLSLLSLSTEATAIYSGPELTVRFANEGILKMFGKGRGIIGKRLLEVLPEISGQKFPALLLEVLETGQAYRATEAPAMLLIDGELQQFYFDFEYRAIFGPNGQPEAILHTARDVSGKVAAMRLAEEQKLRETQLIEELSQTSANVQLANQNLSDANAELLASNESINRLNARLQESETDFKRLVEQAPVAILVFRGPDMVIDEVNEAMLEILGKDKSVIGKPLLEGLPEIKGAPAVDMLFEVFNTGRALDGNEAAVPIKRNGLVETRYFNFSYRPLLDRGNIIGVMDVAVEVTEQVLARQRLEAIILEKTVLEHDLRTNQKRLQGILDTMAEGVVIVGPDGTPTYANPMAQRIMGMAEEQFKDRSYNDAKWRNERLDGTLLPKEDHPMHVVMRTGLPVYDQEIVIVMPSKEKLYIAINAAPLAGGGQQIVGAIVTFTDVTNRRMVLQQKEDFISVASHELKTPVTSLKGSLQLLERIQENIKPEVLARLIAQANKSLNKLSELINRLLNSNRISQGRFPMHKTNFLVADMINDCCEHVRSTGTHDINLECDPGLKIIADEQLIEQVLVNLINNAVKYAPNSQIITVNVKKVTGATRVAITDNGPGIPAEKAARIFERYYQATDAGRQFSGLGLGLYISAEIIHKHGGEIGVDSKVGDGSTFWFTIPGNG